MRRKIEIITGLAAVILAVLLIAGSVLTSAAQRGALLTGMPGNSDKGGKTDKETGAAAVSQSDTIFMRVGSSVALVGENKLSIDPDNRSVIPFTRGGVVYAPLRFIVENIGGSVSGEGNNVYSITAAGRTVRLTAGSSDAEIDGDKVKLDAPAVIYNDRLYAPLEFVEAFGGLNVSCENELICIYAGAKPELSRGDADALLAKLSVITAFASRGEMDAYVDRFIEEESLKWGYYDDVVYATAGFEMDTQNSTAPAPAAAEQAESAVRGAAGTDDFSSVNTQVAGVDEADIIRTDGKYIYAIAKGRLYIVDAYPAASMTVVSVTDFAGGNPRELYADKDKLVVITDGYNTKTGAASAGISVIDISDRENPKQVKELKTDGTYFTSRKIDSYVYLVVNSYRGFYRTDGVIPCAYLNDGAVREIPAPSIYVLPGRDYSQTTLIGLDIAALDKEPNVSQYWGTGSNIYVSRNHMYIAQTVYGDISDDFAEIIPWQDRGFNNWRQSTVVHKFLLNEARVSYIGSGAVKGYVLNQFSMDEHENHFRIATNADDANHVFILDSQMNVKSKIEDIAPGERIYSARFMGRKGYMVTFKTVDPLFVIDLDPNNPQILGALKIPGYSDYLHPYDENHLIGFGKDAVEHKGMAFYQGMKVAIFDVSDVSDPKELHSMIIGGRGTESPLLYNHKALLFDRNKNLLAFPITVYEGGDGITGYGAFTFTGAYVYDLTLERGFVKRGEITHVTDDEYIKSGNSWYYGGEAAVNRILFIENHLYAVSDRKVTAHDINTVLQVSDAAFE